LKPLSRLKFSLFSLMWMASFTIRSRYNDLNLSRAWFPITRINDFCRILTMVC
jgi:hypothetical protein